MNGRKTADNQKQNKKKNGSAPHTTTEMDAS